MENSGMSQSMQVLTSTKTAEWFTPPEYLEFVKKVFTNISLDPASNKKAQEWIRADNWYGLDHDDEKSRDGLSNEWFWMESPINNVFCNPPYNHQTRHWVQKAESEYVNFLKECGGYDWNPQVIMLVSSANGYVWWEDMLDKWTTCLVRERIRFIDESGNQNGQAKKGSAFCYLGSNTELFSQVFSSIGRIIKPVKSFPQIIA